ncbi:ABC transporter permease [Nocardia bovistercoris]|uniref:ABC transporter permease n=1 Tax=Nocardia bovistercoris TaxID=2785916 RepID=A0A931I7Y0_9NOCA|nr:ABC transporter permease [Nocardia bovistercoris]MBH0775515.1 ABC transporter permease [Nocardia bovistercoris]
MTPSAYLPGFLRPGRRVRSELIRPVDAFGFGLGFVWQVVASIPLTLRRYRAETMRAVTSMTWGRGSLIVGGGTVPMMAVLGVAIGASVGIEAAATLDLLGLGSMTGIVSAFANTRELAPIAAGVGFAAQGGCRMTAEIGSMRISEEIDALESLGLQSVAFVVTTRVLAAALAIVPTFLIALILSYLSCSWVVTLLHKQPAGVYHHYFSQFITSPDIWAAVAKVLVFSIAVILVHSYHGFFAVGGPEGVGVASGRAVRASFVLIVVLDMLLTLLFWGVDSAVEFTG